MDEQLTVQQRLALLREPLSSRDIEWRVGSVNRDKTRGQALPYLTFVAVADRLDEVMGPGSWSCDYKQGPAGGVICRLGICVEGAWVFKENGAENTDVEAVKGGLTDALMRAAAMWGIGRYLYRFNPVWMALTDGKYLATQPALPDHMLPVNERQAVGQDKDKKAEHVVPETGEVVTTGDAAVQPLPEGLTAFEKRHISELMKRLLKGGPPTTVREYVTGEKGKAKLGEAARTYILQARPA